MEPNPLRRLLKYIYINLGLGYKLRNIIQHSDFIINYSGYYHQALNRIGWSDKKIISCGYFPPPVPNSHLIKRDESNWNDFTILLSGIHQWHRSPIILLKALSVLKQMGMSPKCYITQEGPMLQEMKSYVASHDLKNVEFLGFVSMDRLINLYETCSVYVELR